MTVKSDHARITGAGWSYRANDRGWIIYHNPQTGLWHTRAQALTILEPWPYIPDGREQLCS